MIQIWWQKTNRVEIKMLVFISVSQWKVLGKGMTCSDLCLKAIILAVV